MENTTKALSPKKKAWLEVKDYLIIMIGMLMYGIGWTVFLVPNQLPLGAVPGIASIVYWGTGFPIQYTYLIVNAALLLLALKILGLRFCVKTICSVIALTVFLGVIQSLVKGNLVHEPFMACVIGASFCGGGIGLAFSANGSTGGTDIIGAVINKYKNISIGRILLFCDFFIISSSFFLFHNVDKIVFGFVEMVISNYVLDMVLNGNRQSVQFLIFSQKYDEIADRIIHDLGRGCTILDGEGGYSRKPVKVVVLLAKKSESVSIFRIVKRIDHQAFISQSIVRGVYGEGFDQIKT